MAGKKRAVRKGASAKRPAAKRAKKASTRVVIPMSAHPVDILKALDKWSSHLDSWDIHSYRVQLASFLSALRGPDFEHTMDDKMMSTGRVRALFPNIVMGVTAARGSLPVTLDDNTIPDHKEPRPRKVKWGVQHFNGHILSATVAIETWINEGKLKLVPK